MVGVFAVGVVVGAQDGADGQEAGVIRATEEAVYFAVVDLAEVGSADPALAHAGGVDGELCLRAAVLQDVALVVGRDVDDEGVVAFVHVAVGAVARDFHGRLEVGRQDGVADAVGKGAVVFVDDGDGGIPEVGVALAHGNDDAGVHVEGEDDKDGVAEQAAQFFAGEGEDVFQGVHGHFSCFFRLRQAAVRKTA